MNLEDVNLEVDNLSTSLNFKYMHPKLKFKISYEKDVQTFFAFNSNAHYDNGRTLEWAFFRKFPFLKKYRKGNILNISNKEITYFVKSFYHKREKLIHKNISLYQKKWKSIENNFYNLTDNIFDDKFWPSGKYIVYPTIWGMFPRFLEDKTFQVPYRYRNKKYVNVIIAHEMLHFVFYNYFYKKYPEYKKDRYNFFVWHISEIFNVIIQNSSKWLKVFKVKTLSYPEHQKIINILRNKYYHKKDLQTDGLIKDIIKFVNNSNLIEISK